MRNSVKPPSSLSPNINQRGDGYNEIRKIARAILKYWFLFLLFVSVSIATGWLRYKSEVPVYRASATMLFKVNPDRNIPQSFLTEGIGLSPEMRLLENQTFIIRNHSMVLRAVNRLPLGVSYYAEQQFADRGLYGMAPFEVRFDSAHHQILNTPVRIEFMPNGRINLSVKTDGAPLHRFDLGENIGYKSPFEIDTIISTGQAIQHPAFSFSIHPGVTGSIPAGGKYYFIFSSHADVASRLLSSLNVSQYSEGSSIIFLTVTGHQPQKLVDFLNVFSQEVIIDNLARKNDIASHSINFIQEQLEQIADTLEITGNKIMDFKRQNRFLIPADVSSKLSEEVFGLEMDRIALDASYNFFSTVKLRLISGDFNEKDIMLPAFSNEAAGIIQQFVLEHLKLLQEYNLIGNHAGSVNPYQLELNQRLMISRQNLLVSIEKQMESITMRRQEISSREAQLRVRMDALPELERDFLALERTHELNDAIYTFLLQKNSEMQIAKASNVPDNEMLGQASVDGPISPVRRRIFSRAILVGLMLPLLIIGFVELFNTRVRTRDDIVGLFNDIPIVGTITRNSNTNEAVVLGRPDSIIAESFRSLRVKLRFLLSGEPGNVILITSTNTGEGKTFCSVNLASAFAMAGKRVLLVEFDLRKPRISSIFNRDNPNGLSNYIIGQFEFEDIVQSTYQQNLHLVVAGSIPPNPAELISSARVTSLFEEARARYDVIIVDTPPIGLVSDARLLNDYCDCQLLVVRSGVTHKEHFSLTLQNLISEKVACLGLVLNDISSSSYGRGYYQSGYFSN